MWHPEHDLAKYLSEKVNKDGQESRPAREKKGENLESRQ